MSKKFVIITAAVLIAVTFCLCSCNIVTDQVLKNLTDMFKLDYSKVELDVSSAKDDITLYGTFVLVFVGDEVDITYRYDKLNTFGTDGVLTAPDDWKTSVQGSAKVKDGAVIEGDASADLPIDAISFDGFVFDKAVFDNIKAGASRFEADVADPQTFVGNGNFVCSDMHVNIKFGDYIGRMEISYVSANGADIVLVYNFTR